MHLAQSDGHIATVARPLRPIYQHPSTTGLARCLTTFSTVSTLQDCNSTSSSRKVFCSGLAVPAVCPPRLLHTWIALACIRIRFFAGKVLCLGVFMSVVAKDAKNDKGKGMVREDEMGSSVWLE